MSQGAQSKAAAASNNSDGSRCYCMPPLYKVLEGMVLFVCKRLDKQNYVHVEKSTLSLSLSLLFGEGRRGLPKKVPVHYHHPECSNFFSLSAVYFAILQVRVRAETEKKQHLQAFALLASFTVTVPKLSACVLDVVDGTLPQSFGLVHEVALPVFLSPVNQTAPCDPHQ
ncbi:hypothetical protein MUK42_23318 [Musa troglodytarum]|uniref:Uncharacterized protein n=1 Tax=Musa troglodytarum TaxID=320322 RepID=A0A9E7IBA6_9LILI|nr:hypothetical protein MUK42_23318 [Musa troglodytarum]